MNPAGQEVCDAANADEDCDTVSDDDDASATGEVRHHKDNDGDGYGDRADKDTDPRGLPVVGDDGETGGTVVDLWVDKAESLFRYIEVELNGGARRVLLPMNFARIRKDRVTVKSILGHQFADVPGTKSTDQVTQLEEEKIMAYYGAGTLYAEPSRVDPLV